MLRIQSTQLRIPTTSHVRAGPTKTTVSTLVAPWLQLYIAQLQFEYHPKEQPYLWSVGGDLYCAGPSNQATLRN